MIVVDRISAHDSHGKAVLAAPREDTKRMPSACSLLRRNTRKKKTWRNSSWTSRNP